MRKFAERLKELRMEKSESIAVLSKHLKLGVASICRWENGKSDVKGDQLILISKYFGVTVDYLLGLED